VDYSHYVSHTCATKYRAKRLKLIAPRMREARMTAGLKRPPERRKNIQDAERRDKPAASEM